MYNYASSIVSASGQSPVSSRIVCAAAAFALCMCGSAAQATLTPITYNGVPMVQSSLTNATYVANGNLLGTWIAERGVQAVFNDLAAVTPSVTLSPNSPWLTVVHTLNISDIDGWWGANGATNFYGAVAVINYMNSIAYGGITSWQLPRQENGTYPNPALSGYTRSSDLGGLTGFGLIAGTPHVLKFLNEEHGVIEMAEPSDTPRVGDRVRVIPNHVCVVSNLFDRVNLIRGDQVIETVPVAARGRVD